MDGRQLVEVARGRRGAARAAAWSAWGCRGGPSCIAAQPSGSPGASASEGSRPGPGRRRVELVRPERPHGTVARPAADHLDPDLARLAVGDVGHELPGGAAQPGPVDLHRIARAQPGPAGAAAQVSHVNVARTRGPSRPFYLLGRMCRRVAAPPYPDAHGARPPTHPQPVQGRRLHQLPARLPLLPDRAPARAALPPRRQGHPGARRAGGPLLAPLPGARTPGRGPGRARPLLGRAPGRRGVRRARARPRRGRRVPGRRPHARRQLLPPGGPERGTGGGSRAGRRDHGRRHAPARHHRPARRDAPTAA